MMLLDAIHNIKLYTHEDKDFNVIIRDISENEIVFDRYNYKNGEIKVCNVKNRSFLDIVKEAASINLTLKYFNNRSSGYHTPNINIFLDNYTSFIFNKDFLNYYKDTSKVNIFTLKDIGDLISKYQMYPNIDVFDKEDYIKNIPYLLGNFSYSQIKNCDISFFYYTEDVKLVDYLLKSSDRYRIIVQIKKEFSNYIERIYQYNDFNYYLSDVIDDNSISKEEVIYEFVKNSTGQN